MKAGQFSQPLPSDFQGFRDDIPVQIYKSSLPHWRQDGATYFATFRLADSIPASALRFLNRMKLDWEHRYQGPWSSETWENYLRTHWRYSEGWLDKGIGECLLGERRWTELLRDTLHFYDNRKYQLQAWAILQTHCHLIMRPKPSFELEAILGRIKSYTARIINKELGRSGRVWSRDTYDRIIRDADHLWNVIQYL